MADDRPPHSETPPVDTGPEFKRSKRPGPTIDLSATEIPRTPDPMEPEPAPDAATEAAADLPPAPERPAPKPSSPILIPALAGAAAASLVTIIITIAGWPVGTPAQDLTPQAASNPPALDELTARLARLENRQAVTPPPAPAAPSLAPRLDALDKTVAGLRDELAEARRQAGQAQEGVAAIKAAPPPVAAPAPPPDLSEINARLAQLDTAIKAQAAAVAREAAKPADDAPLRRMVAVSLLDVQVRQNQPYAAALKVAAPGLDATRLKPLETFAATGVPTATAMADELQALAPKLTPPPAAAAPSTTGTGILDRLQAGAARLVKIERHAEPAAESATAILGRAVAAMRRNDGAAARRELATLPANDKTLVQPWLARADARDAALAASQQLAADALTALAKPAP